MTMLFFEVLAARRTDLFHDRHLRDHDDQQPLSHPKNIFTLCRDPAQRFRQQLYCYVGQETEDKINGFGEGVDLPSLAWDAW